MVLARYRKEITEVIGQDPEHLPERSEMERALLEIILPYLKPEYAPAPNSGLTFRSPETTYPSDPNDVRAHAEFTADVTIGNCIAEIADHLAHAQTKPTPKERRNSRDRAVVRATVLTTGAWMLGCMVMREDFIARALELVNSSQVNALTLDQLTGINIHEFTTRVPELPFTGLDVLHDAHTTFDGYSRARTARLDRDDPADGWEDPYREALMVAGAHSVNTALRTIDDLHNGRSTDPDPLSTIMESTRTAILLEQSAVIARSGIFPHDQRPRIQPGLKT